MRTRSWIVVVAIGVLVAARSISGMAETVHLKFLFADYTGQPWTDATKVLVEEFNATHPDIQVELISGVAGYARLEERLRVYVAAGQQVDIYENHGPTVQHLVRSGLLLDLVPYMERDGLLDEYAADLGEGVMESIMAVTDGKLGSLPSFGSVSAGMLYNPVLFDEAGLDHPPVSWTWDEFRSVARRLTQDTSGDGSQKQFGFIDEVHYLYQWMWQNGVFKDFLQDENGNWRFQYLEPEGRETIQFLAGLQQEGIAQYHRANTGASGAYLGLFGEGRAAMRMHLYSSLVRLRDNHDITASMVRRPYNRAEATDFGNSAFDLHLVASGDPVREAAAWEFLKWRTSREVDMRNAEMQNTFPWRASNLQSPAFIELLERLQFSDEARLMAEYMVERGRSLSRTNVRPVFKSGAYPDSLREPVFNAIEGKTPVPEALEQVQRAFFAELDE